LGSMVWIAWPNEQLLDLTRPPESAKRLVKLFFLGQFALISLMTPSFASGAIAGEKERKTYEMLLASPMGPGAVVLGKLVASLCHLGVLLVATLPIVMLCVPLGGVSPYEVLATYVAMAAAVVAFGMISIASSAYFTRSAAALIVSYMQILPFVLLGVFVHEMLETSPRVRLVFLAGGMPLVSLALCIVLFRTTTARLLHPPDVGSESGEVVDLDVEQKEAVGLVIQRDRFPDSLFAPSKRTDLMADRQNVVFDKEMRSELFSQGSLMLRMVIQMSMVLGLVMMAVCLYIQSQWAPWYAAYVLLFNMLVGPVFSAGSITSERERQTLELLLTTTLSPWHILWGKLLAGLRISSVLTSFLLWALLLAWVIPPWTYLSDTPTLLGYALIVALSSLTTTTIAMFCSVVFRKTTVAMTWSYLIVIVLFAVPPAVLFFADRFFPEAAAASDIAQYAFTSPFSACFSLPLTLGEYPPAVAANWPVVWRFLLFYVVLNSALLSCIAWLFNRRWRAASTERV